MDFDEIVDIPDTPDRIGKSKRDGRGGCSLIPHSEDLSMIAGKKVTATQNQPEGRFVYRRGINISEPSGIGRSSVVSVHNHSSASESAPLFRKVGNKSLKPDGRYHINSQHADNMKEVHRSCSSKPVNHPEQHMGKFMMGGNTHRLQKTFSHCVLEEDKASKSKGDLLASNSLYYIEDPSKANINLNKGKEKINDDPCKTVPSRFDMQKCLYSSKDDSDKLKISSHVSLPVHSGTSSRVAGRKRLVRNGCISPQNVAKAKQVDESSSNFNGDFKRTGTNEMTKVDPSIVINVDEELSGRSKSKGKGKEIVSHPDSSGEHDTEMRNLIKRTSGVAPLMNQSRRANANKRQRKDDPPLNCQDRDEEIIFVGSRGKVSKPSSSGSHTHHNPPRRRRALDTVIEIDENSLKVGSSNSQSENDLAAIARARQLEADEMLARELQEQLYHEMPVIQDAEIDSRLARRLQQEENVQQAPQRGISVNFVSFRNGTEQMDSRLARRLQQEENVQQAPQRGISVNLGASSSPLPRRQSRSQLFQNRFRRGAQARAPTPRLTRFRNSIQRTSTMFPSNMNLEMRVELLEALEAVVSDDMNMVNELLNPAREFTESDYDMLLALDDNNHRHLGASSAQISNLPESIVQTSNGDSCSICLEEPTIGETIRHLPCLHKFHKDCIDSWLRRKRSCPICKSDVT